MFNLYAAEHKQQIEENIKKIEIKEKQYKQNRKSIK